MGSDCLSDRLADHQITVSISLSFPSFLCLGNAFVSLEFSLEFLTFFSLFSFIHAWTFISLQIKEFQIMGLSIKNHRKMLGGLARQLLENQDLANDSCFASLVSSSFSCSFSSFFFQSFLCFLWIGAQFPQVKFL